MNGDYSSHNIGKNNYTNFKLKLKGFNYVGIISICILIFSWGFIACVPRKARV